MALPQDFLSCPVTAVAFGPSDARIPLLVNAHGPGLKVYHKNHFLQLCVFRVFENSTIHGIVLRSVPGAQRSKRSIRSLVWGEKSVRCLVLKFRNVKGSLALKCEALSKELKIEDWILYADLLPVSWWSDAENEPFALGYLITALNELHIIVGTWENGSLLVSSQKYAHGSATALYSASAHWVHDGSIRVAAGTVFGEIQLWAVDFKGLTQPNSKILRPKCTKILKGHKGSVYGIQIAPIGQSGLTTSSIIASCSDDRTVRSWIIAQDDWENYNKPSGKFMDQLTGFQATENRALTNDRDESITAVNQGLVSHKSRIWSVEILMESENEGFIFSFGEDCSMHIWHFKLLDKDVSKGTELPLTWVQSSKFHFGRNIWASSTDLSKDNAIRIATGGADGRTALHALYRMYPVSPLPPGSRQNLRHRELDKIDPSIINNRHTLEGTDPREGTPTKSIESTINSYALLDNGDVFATTFRGDVLLGTHVAYYTGCGTFEKLKIGQYDDIQWKHLYQIPELSGSSSIARINGYGALIGGRSGAIHAYSSVNQTIKQVAVCIGTVATVLAVENWVREPMVHAAVVESRHFGTDGHSTRFNLIRWADDASDDSLSSIIPLPQFPYSGFTAATYTRAIDSLALGTRNGTMVLMNCDNLLHDQLNVDTFVCRGIHEHNGITQILDLTNQRFVGKNSYLLTTGRDGKACIRVLRPPQESTNISVLHSDPVHAAKLPFGANVAGASFEPRTGHILVWGFQGGDFILWDYNHHMELMRVKCEGVPRHWDFLPPEEERKGARLVWTRKSTSYTYSQDQPSHRLIGSGFHGREVKTMAIQRYMSGSHFRQLIATGAEDTTIRIAEYEPYAVANNDAEVVELVTRCVIEDHTTGICQLRWSPCGMYLFSSGGKGEFFVWKVSALPHVTVGVILQAKCPDLLEGADVRIMDFAVHAYQDEKLKGDDVCFLVTTVHSDSSLYVRIPLFLPCEALTGQVWDFRPARKDNNVRLIATGLYRLKCLTRAHFLRLKNAVYLLSASTDGHLAIWEIPLPWETPPSKRTAGDSSEGENRGGITYSHTHRIHQSSIKTLDIPAYKSCQNPILIATGGDDNAVAITMLGVYPVSQNWSFRLSTLLIPKAHAAAVTAVLWLPSLDTDGDKKATPYDPGKSNRHLLLSASNDQTLRIWEVWLHPCDWISESTNPAKYLDVRKFGQRHSEIADICTVKLLLNKRRWKVVVAGVGIETWDLGMLLQPPS